MKQKDLMKQVKEAVLEIETNAEILLYGSRARGDNYPFSDVDIAVLPKGKIGNKKITFLKEKIEESNIPYKVEIINLRETSDEFRDEVLKEAIVWSH